MHNYNIKNICISFIQSVLSAKTWGDENDEHVLVFHGVMDNAGSFDRLIPLLPKNFYYICFDLPSHGKSSYLPLFFPVHTTDYLLVYKILVEYFKKKSYIFLGHSYGGIISCLFGRLYPQYVKKLIVIDGVILDIFEVEELKTALVKNIDATFKIYEKSLCRSKPTYTYEEALKRVRESRLTRNLTDNEAIPLLTRAIEPDGKLYITK